MYKQTRESHATNTNMVESRLQTLIFPPLNTDGSNFLEWVIDPKTFLNAKDLAKTLKHSKPSTSTNDIDEAVPQIPVVSKWLALVLLCRHIDQAFRLQYLEIDDPADLWTQLYTCFHH